jgi:H+/gluconate symporter-like permease
LDTGTLIGIFGIVVTILFGIVGLLFIPYRHSQRQKATGAHSTAIQSGRDNIIVHGPATFHSKTSDARSDALPIAVLATILLAGVSSYYIWDKNNPPELQQTLLLDLAPSVILLLSVMVAILWIRLLKKRRY